MMAHFIAHVFGLLFLGLSYCPYKKLAESRRLGIPRSPRGDWTESAADKPTGTTPETDVVGVEPPRLTSDAGNPEHGPKKEV